MEQLVDEQNQLVEDSLARPALRSTVLDVLAGAPYEFEPEPDSSEAKDFHHLPRLARRAAAGASLEDVEALRSTVVGIVSTGGGWASGLRRRLLEVMRAPCAAGAEDSQTPLALQIDHKFSSPGATSGTWLQRLLLGLGARTGLTVFKSREAMYRSRSASIILSGVPPSVGDCLALRGNASVALRLQGGPEVVAQVDIEQPARWAAHNMKSLPGRFEVFGDVEEEFMQEAYRAPLGSFEYKPAGPAQQTFQLSRAVRLRGFLLRFEENSGEYTCLYRLKAYSKGTCSDA